MGCRRPLCALAVVVIGCGEPPGGDDVVGGDDEGSGTLGPISGGTLLVTGDGRYAVVADPDRDRVLTVDLDSEAIVARIALTAGDEPGRLVEDGAGRIHVALRSGGALVTLDPLTGAITARRAACTEPRGVAWSAIDDVVHVACNDGQLVTFPAAGGGDATRRVQLDRDLRDVVAVGDQLVVTRFRTAEVLTLDASGAVASRYFPPTAVRNDVGTPEPGDTLDSTPAVAWRAVPVGDGRVAVVHQRRLHKVLRTDPSPGGGGGYDNTDPDDPDPECFTSVIEAALTVFAPGQPATSVAHLPIGPLPVDLAIAPGASSVAVAVASTPEVTAFRGTALAWTDSEPCPVPAQELARASSKLGAPTAVAYRPDGALVELYPEAPALVVRSPDLRDREVIELPGYFGYDAGRAIFHANTAVGMACASCHPEGRDDGQVWELADVGPRRTQSVAGDILARGPYHWSGDQADIASLVREVFVERMAGLRPSTAHTAALGTWLDHIPAPAPLAGDPAAIERGRAIFESAEVGCVACHNGPLHTNNQLVDVGTGSRLKVPSLRGVWARAPFLHDGCAPTLRDRLVDPCGGGDQHGVTSTLDAAQRRDLITYLEAL
jgi:hypothetical protein